MKQNIKLHKDSSTSRMLNELVDDLDYFFTLGFQPARVLRYGMDGVRAARDARDRIERRQSLRRLEKMKLILIKKRGSEYRVALTERGVLESLRQKVINADLLPNGTVCIVVFDVPEVERKTRKMLREFLKESCFIQKQRSVWISPFKAGEALRNLFKMTGAIGWVTIYYGDEVE